MLKEFIFKQIIEKDLMKIIYNNNKQLNKNDIKKAYISYLFYIAIFYIIVFIFSILMYFKPLLAIEYFTVVPLIYFVLSICLLKATIDNRILSFHKLIYSFALFFILVLAFSFSFMILIYEDMNLNSVKYFNMLSYSLSMITTLGSNAYFIIPENNKDYVEYLKSIESLLGVMITVGIIGSIFSNRNNDTRIIKILKKDKEPDINNQRIPIFKKMGDKESLICGIVIGIVISITLGQIFIC